MKKLLKISCAIIALAVVLISGSSFSPAKNKVSWKEKPPQTIEDKYQNENTNTLFCETCGKNPETTLKTEMRKLWEDHVVWTRNVILCLVDELPGLDQASKRLLKNQDDIGNAIKPFYGEEAGKKLTELLYAHINIAVDVINSAKTSNTIELAAANKKWSANANEISEFLCKANPKWELAAMKKMMDSHLKLTTDEVVQRIKKNYEADIIAYDNVHTEILEMADMLTDGIIKQFPDKFPAKKAQPKKDDEKITTQAEQK